jgi:hypothetical protein
MTPEERTPKFLIANGYLERCTDWSHDHQPVLSSRLGWRITDSFVRTFCGRILGNPNTLFGEPLLRPEKQDLAIFADGMENIVTAMRSAATSYFADGSIEQAVPPLRALLHLMRDGKWEGHSSDAPAFRALFTREAVLASDWYRARLAAQQKRDARHWETQAGYLEKFLGRTNYADVAAKLGIAARLAATHAAAAAARAPDYVESLSGTLGVDPALVAK